MTPLESKAIRDSRGINTYERGMLYATLLLIVSNTSPNNTKKGANNPYYDAIKLNFERGKVGKSEEEDSKYFYFNIDPKIIIEAYLPYDREASLKSGGNFFEHIKSFDNIDPNPTAISVEPEPNPFDTIQNSPVWVNSLEKYLVSMAMKIEYQTYYYEDDFERKAEISFVENNSGNSFVKIVATLPYDHDTFLEQRNLLSALKTYPITR